MTNTQIKIALYRNYGLFVSTYCPVDRSSFVALVKEYVAFAISQSTQYPDDFSTNYSSVSELLQDFYYCSF